MIRETCSCGASFTGPSAYVPDWRANHRHDVSKIAPSGHGDACRCGGCLCTYRPGEPHDDLWTCTLCDHRGDPVSLATVYGPDWPAVAYLCHGCEKDHDCYRLWTVHGVRPVKASENSAETTERGYLSGHKDGYAAGRADAARDVEALPGVGSFVDGTGRVVAREDAVRAARGGER